MGRIAAGSLTERITLRTPGPSVPDGRGGQKPGTPGTPVTVWARKVELTGREALRLGQTAATVVVEFTIRKRAGVSVTTLVEWNGQSYAVQRVVHDDRHEYSVLTCLNNGRN
jgi:SPP1 family predicted phage head-tail adaptor